MGSGTASGVQTHSQPGVIVRERENFPPIPPELLTKTPEELQRGIDRINRAIDFNDERIFPDVKLQENLENAAVIYEFAITAVQRARAAQTLS